jgi:hypothetical protein
MTMSVSTFPEVTGAPPTKRGRIKQLSPSVPVDPQLHVPTAVVYCEGQFGALDGKTANGLVRHSEKYEILSVIDS